MNGDEFASLIESMKVVGQLTPIYTHRGEVIDGRAKLRACQRLRIEPIIEKIDPSLDPLDVVDALNLRRRHLTTAELAMAASRLNRRLPQDLATIGISKRSLEHADKVHRDGAPETIEAASDGKVALSLASRISDLPKQHQADKVQKIQEGKKSEVIAELKAIKPVRKKAADERPTVKYQDETPTPDLMVELFAKTTDRIETIRRLIDELADHELMIVQGFLQPQKMTQAQQFEQDNYDAQMAAILCDDDDEVETDDEPADAEPELVDLEAIEIVRDRVSDEMIQSPQMVGLGGRLASLATAVGAVRLLFAATEKHTPRGDIGKLSDPAIATACGFTGNAEQFVSALVQEGFLQRDIEHRLLVSDWPDLCLPDLAEELVGTGVGFAEPTGVPKMKEKPAPKIKNAKPSQYSEAFERFWQAYPSPRKKAKLKAWAAWQKALHIAVAPEGTDVDEWLIERATQYAKSWKGQSEYSSAPEVWLNGGSWDDAPEAWTEFRKKPSEAPSWTSELRQPPKPLMVKQESSKTGTRNERFDASR
jgi:ParB-like chromosome segregation protein Spo0J